MSGKPPLELRMFVVYRQSDVGAFGKVVEKAGGMFTAAVLVPFRNVRGDIVTWQYVILYEHTEELTMEILT